MRVIFGAQNWSKTFLTFWLVLAALLSFSGCQQQKNEPQELKAEYDQGFTQLYSNGPLDCEQWVSSQTITSADQLRVKLYLETDEGFGLAFPTTQQDFGEFNGTLIEKGKIALTTKGRIGQEITYLLEPPGPGEFKVPALTVATWDKSLDEAEVVQLQTEPILIKVSSLFVDAEDAPQLNDIESPVAQPMNRWLILVIVAGGALVIAILAYLILKKSKKERVAPPPIPAHIKAAKALDRLLAEQLIVKGQIKLFYEKVSDILRSYIEERFGLKAPERTTEEFLSELSGQSTVLQPVLLAHKTLITKFLTHCDLVKFAEHQPTDDDVDMVVSICREFFQATKPGNDHDQAIEANKEGK